MNPIAFKLMLHPSAVFFLKALYPENLLHLEQWSKKNKRFIKMDDRILLDRHRFWMRMGPGIFALTPQGRMVVSQWTGVPPIVSIASRAEEASLRLKNQSGSRSSGIRR